MQRSWRTFIAASALAATLAAVPVAASAASYTVQPGDTLWKISTKAGVTVDQVKRMNHLKSNSLYIGQKLELPNPPEFETIYAQPGDTLWKIGMRHGIPLKKMIAANPQLADPNVIWTGLELRLPKKPDAYLNGVFPLAPGTYSPYINSYAAFRDWSSSGSAARSHEGVDIFAEEGTPVYSAYSGTVVQAGWSELGGWRVTVRVDDHTEFYYAHLSKYAPGIWKGAKVSAGQWIGYVGSTGYGPEGTKGKFESHLHFGIYKRTPKYSAVDPFLYLKWWELR